MTLSEKYKYFTESNKNTVKNWYTYLQNCFRIKVQPTQIENTPPPSPGSKSNQRKLRKEPGHQWPLQLEIRTSFLPIVGEFHGNAEISDCCGYALVATIHRANLYLSSGAKYQKPRSNCSIFQFIFQKYMSLLIPVVLSFSPSLFAFMSCQDGGWQCWQCVEIDKHSTMTEMLPTCVAELLNNNLLITIYIRIFLLIKGILCMIISCLVSHPITTFSHNLLTHFKSSL